MTRLQVFLFGMFVFALDAGAETYICSYEGYLDNGDLIILEIDIDGEWALVSSQNVAETKFRVLENNEFGLVMVSSFSMEGTESPTPHDIGAFVLVIDKAKMRMARANVFFANENTAYREGSCRT